MRNLTEGHAFLSGAAQFAPLEADYHEAVVLEAGTSQAVPIPEGAVYVLPSFTGDFYWKFGDSEVEAAVPTETTDDGSGSALNPTQRRIPPDATHVALIAEEACKGSLSFWK